MKVLYLIQTYKNPAQIKRLVSTIKRLSPNSQILITHDSNSPPLNSQEFTSISGLYLISNPGGRGDFFTVQSCLDALKWSFVHQIEFDWIVNLSGQCYPTQPLAAFEQFLAETQFDGFLEYRDVLSENGYYGLRESLERYFYQYWHSGIHLDKPWQKALIKPIRVLVNNSQPFLKLTTSYQVSWGIRNFRDTFNVEFKCFGGSLYKILSRKCAQYLQETAEKRVDLVDYYKKTIAPEESFMQTVLANSKLFNLCDKNYFYMDWNNSKHGRPKILTMEDYPILTESKDIYFARKFDPAVDNEILDRLDSHLFK